MLEPCPAVQRNVGPGLELARFGFAQHVEGIVGKGIILHGPGIARGGWRVQAAIGGAQVDGFIGRKIVLHAVSQADEATRIVGRIGQKAGAKVDLDRGVLGYLGQQQETWLIDVVHAIGARPRHGIKCQTQAGTPLVLAGGHVNLVGVRAVGQVLQGIQHHFRILRDLAVPGKAVRPMLP